jgi:hypothetical protein
VRAQVRRKGKYVNNTFLRRRDAPKWGLETERRIDRGEPSIARREARAFGNVALWAAEAKVAAIREVVRAWVAITGRCSSGLLTDPHHW